MDLLLDIVHCPNAKACLANPEAEHACGEIVRSQKLEGRMNFQVPEPWSGHLETAPILFLSSNPSISEDEQYPRLEWGDELIGDFFENRFGEGKQPWITEGRYYLRKNGKPSEKWVHYWASIRKRAAELLEPREVTSGIDYALTEVVHCKSKSEEGVRSALDECAERYLRPIVEASAATVVVCLGDKAGQKVRPMFEMPEKRRVFGPIRVGQRDRYFTFLPHPNSRGKRKSFADNLSQAELERLRQILAVGPTAPEISR